MYKIISFPKDNSETLTYNTDDILSIYDIKKFLSEKTKNAIGQIFIFDFEKQTFAYSFQKGKSYFVTKFDEKERKRIF